MFSRNLAAAIAIPVLVGASLLAGATSANAACGDSSTFCAYYDASYGGGTLLAKSGVFSDGQQFDIDDNQVTSAKNRYSAYYWCGFNTVGFFQSQLEFQFNPLVNISNVGADHNDKIDHFNLRKNYSYCLNAY